MLNSAIRNQAHTKFQSVPSIGKEVVQNNITFFISYFCGVKIRVRDKEILNLALPSIVSNITVPLLGLVDLAIVGHIGNESYIGAIAIGTMIFNVTYWVLNFLRMGTGGLAAQSYGQNNWQECLRVLIRSLAIGLGIGFILIATGKWVGPIMMQLMNTPKTAAEAVMEYYNIVVFGAPAMLGLYSLTGWFVGMQNTRAPMLVAILQNVVNIAVSLLLVLGFEWKIEGVATGTLVAQWSGFAIAMALAWQEIRHKIPTSDRQARHVGKAITQLQAWKRFFSVNSDIFFRTLCLVAVNTAFTSAGGRQGATMLAVNTLLMTMFTLFSYVMDGFAYAGEALSGKYYGASDWHGLKDVARRLFVFGGLMTVLFTAVYAIGGRNFLVLLTDQRQVIEAAEPYLPLVWLIPLAGVTAFIMDGIFIGLTATKGMLVSSVLAAACFFAVYFLTRDSIGNSGLWLAFLLFLAMRGIVQLLWARFRITQNCVTIKD